MPDVEDDLVVIQSFPDTTAAHLAAGLLESVGIESMLADEHMAGMYPHGGVVGGIKLLVRQSDREAAEAALSDVR
jgi:hypothetical protein